MRRESIRSRAYLWLITLGLVAGSATSFSQSPQTDQSSDLPQVKLRFVETVSSATAKVGQSISLEVTEPVQVDGRPAIAAGAHAHAIVTEARRRGHNRREGRLVLTIESVHKLDGSDALLKSAVVKEGSGHGAPIFGPCTFPFPADPIGLFRKGVDVVVPKGTEFVATVVAGQAPPNP